MFFTEEDKVAIKFLEKANITKQSFLVATLNVACPN